jgi:hypothetical protein
VNLIDEVKQHEFDLKFERNLNEYLSFCIEESKDEGKFTMIQPHLLTCLTQIFANEIKGNRKFLTPDTARLNIQKSKINMDVLDAYYQRRFDKIF